MVRGSKRVAATPRRTTQPAQPWQTGKTSEHELVFEIVAGSVRCVAVGRVGRYRWWDSVVVVVVCVGLSVVIVVGFVVFVNGVAFVVLVPDTLGAVGTRTRLRSRARTSR